VAAAQNPQ
jgi:hypothetical protein